MISKGHIDISKEQIAKFSRRHHIWRTLLFGSVLRDDGLMKMEMELSSLLGGRKVDLVTEKFLNRRILDQVLANAEIQYAER